MLFYPFCEKLGNWVDIAYPPSSLVFKQPAYTLSTEASFVSLRCGAQVGCRIKEGESLRHFLWKGTTISRQRCTVNRYRHRRRGKKLFTVTGKFENFTGKNPVNSDTEVLFRFLFFIGGFSVVVVKWDTFTST